VAVSDRERDRDGVRVEDRLSEGELVGVPEALVEALGDTVPDNNGVELVVADTVNVLVSAAIFITASE
jgi:hypothetical protein